MSWILSKCHQVKQFLYVLSTAAIHIDILVYTRGDMKYDLWCVLTLRKEGIAAPDPQGQTDELCHMYYAGRVNATCHSCHCEPEGHGCDSTL